MLNILFLNSHPIQYFAPLYKTIEKQPDFNLKVLYCSGYGLAGEKDREFGVNKSWDIPVMEGYESVILKNQSLKPTVYNFWGLVNLSIIPYLFKAPKSLLVVHGWGYFTHILTMIVGKIFGHTVCLRGENPASQEQLRNARSLWLRKIVFGKMLFSFVDYFLYIGKENKQFYLNNGVKEEQLFFAPYAVDNNRFVNSFKKLSAQKEALRKKLGLPLDKKIILFSGKYITKKRPLDLLKAFGKCQYKNEASIVFMGEGELREQMEKYIEKKGLKNIFLTGFVNQSKVTEYYAVADLFVMCSQEGETWGLSTNEAMNFSLPVILSNLTGSSSDLVEEGVNGYVFETGNIKMLAEKLDLILGQPVSVFEKMGEQSMQKIQQYSYEQILEGLRSVGSLIKSTRMNNRAIIG
ncbi:MAG TPA: glycosyltransferase [Bacteroidetes bacterium]|nr:glycosyltransferase [Bacteroidota bacterium]